MLLCLVEGAFSRLVLMRVYCRSGRLRCGRFWMAFQQRSKLGLKRQGVSRVTPSGVGSHTTTYVARAESMDPPRDVFGLPILGAHATVPPAQPHHLSQKNCTELPTQHSLRMYLSSFTFTTTAFHPVLHNPHVHNLSCTLRRLSTLYRLYSTINSATSNQTLPASLSSPQDRLHPPMPKIPRWIALLGIDFARRRRARSLRRDRTRPLRLRLATRAVCTLCPPLLLPIPLGRLWRPCRSRRPRRVA